MRERGIVRELMNVRGGNDVQCLGGLANHEEVAKTRA
jgi:hypothetical protein